VQAEHATTRPENIHHTALVESGVRIQNDTELSVTVTHSCRPINARGVSSEPVGCDLLRWDRRHATGNRAYYKVHTHF